MGMSSKNQLLLTISNNSLILCTGQIGEEKFGLPKNDYGAIALIDNWVW